MNYCEQKNDRHGPAELSLIFAFLSLQASVLRLLSCSLDDSDVSVVLGLGLGPRGLASAKNSKPKSKRTTKFTNKILTLLISTYHQVSDE